MKFRHLSRYVLLATLPVSLLAEAAEISSDTVGTLLELDKLQISADGTDSALPARPVSTIYGLPQAVIDTPRSITQITAEELKFDPITSTTDFIKYTPGVNFNAEKNNARGPSVRGAFGDIYQNGFWLAPGVHPLQLAAYEGVDLVSGPAGVIFGPTQRTSSYVNYTTKTPDFSKSWTEVSLNLGRWVAGGGSYTQNVAQIDTTAPLIPDKLAYRVSLVGAGSDTYYDGIKNEYYNAYAALSWRPTGRVTIDWNGQFGRYDYQDVRGWNRITQDLVDNGNYITGSSVPIIRGGPTGFYSPVVDGAGNVTGYLTRTRNATSGKYLAGAAYTPAATATSANTVAGWLLSPTGVRKIEPNWGENSPTEDFNDTEEIITQLRARVQLGDNSLLTVGVNYQRLETAVSGTGMFIYGYTGDYFENRTEFVHSREYRFGGNTIKHDSNTGLSLRYNEINNVSGNPGAFWSSPIDLFGNAKHSVNGLFGTTVIDPAVGSGNTGQAVATKFGSIWFPSTYPTEYSGVYTAAGVANSSVNFSRLFQTGLFTQHNFDFNGKWGLNLGGRINRADATIRNHYPNPTIPKTVTNGDEQSYWIPAGSGSLTFKPVKWDTFYVTYGYSEAINGSASQGLLWDTSTGTTAPVLGEKNFHSVSELFEVGNKAEIIPSKLFASLSLYHQTRVAPIQTVNGVGQDSAQLRARGVEVTLRYEPSRRISTGLNYSYTDIIYLDYAASVQSPYGFVADNETPFALTSSAGLVPIGNYRLSAVPLNSASAYVTYRFDNGFGAKLSAWVQSDSRYKIAYPVTIPSQYNVDLSVWYRQPKWYAQVDFLNITDQVNFANVGVDSVDFLQPLPRFGIQGKIGYRF